MNVEAFRAQRSQPLQRWSSLGTHQSASLSGLDFNLKQLFCFVYDINIIMINAVVNQRCYKRRGGLEAF